MPIWSISAISSSLRFSVNTSHQVFSCSCLLLCKLLQAFKFFSGNQNGCSSSRERTLRNPFTFPSFTHRVTVSCETPNTSAACFMVTSFFIAAIIRTYAFYASVQLFYFFTGHLHQASVNAFVLALPVVTFFSIDAQNTDYFFPPL